MPSLTRSIQSFINRMKGSGPTSKQMLEDLQVSSQYNLYQNCDQLPLDRFIKVVCEGDLNQLIISGTVPLYVLAETWANIFYEYLDLQKNNQAKYRIELARDVAYYQARLTRLQTILYCLRIIYHPDIHAQLKDMGFDVTLDPQNIDEYLGTLQSVETRSKEWSIDMKIKMAELEVLDEQENTDHAKVDKTYFTGLLSKIATYKHVPVIRAGEVTVTEFCAMFEEFVSYIQQLKKAHSKHV